MHDAHRDIYGTSDLDNETIQDPVQLSTNRSWPHWTTPGLSAEYAGYATTHRSIHHGGSEHYSFQFRAGRKSHLRIVQIRIDKSAQPCIHHNKAVLGKFVKRIRSQDIFESGELYTMELRSPDDDEETQPLVPSHVTFKVWLKTQCFLELAKWINPLQPLVPDV